MAGWAKGAPGLCDVDVPVLSASDRDRRELTERHHVAGTRRSTRQRALRWRWNDGRDRNGVAGYRRDQTVALREQSAPVHQEKHGRQEQHSVRWPWNRVVSGMLTAQVMRRVAVT